MLYSCIVFPHKIAREREKKNGERPVLIKKKILIWCVKYVRTFNVSFHFYGLFICLFAFRQFPIQLRFNVFVNFQYIFPPSPCTTTLHHDTITDTGSRVGAVVRALAFHQCVPGSIPGPGVMCGLSLLVLYSAPRGFSPGTPVFPSPQKPTFDLI